jgi:hypothetical protein
MPYYVYVIELDGEVLNSKKFRDQNLRMKPRKACLYVGQSCHDPETRFQQHKQGYKSNRYVRKYGLRLKKRLYKKYNPMKTRKESELMEKKLAEKLRKKGYGVWSN